MYCFLLLISVGVDKTWEKLSPCVSHWLNALSYLASKHPSYET